MHSPVTGIGSRVSQLRGQESPQEWDSQEVGDGGSGDSRGRVELEPQRVSTTDTGWCLRSSAEVRRMGGVGCDTVLYVQGSETIDFFSLFIYGFFLLEAPSCSQFARIRGVQRQIETTASCSK